MLASQAKNMLFTTRYPVDKIVGVYTGSFSIAAAASIFVSRRAEVTIPHTFGESCFLELIFSTDSGTTWQDMGNSVPAAGPVFQTVTAAAYSDASNFVVVGTNQTTSDVTIQYILTASWES